MKWTLAVVAPFGILLAVANLTGQTHPADQMSDTDRAAFWKEQRRERLRGLAGVRVKAFWQSPAASEENDRLQAAVELRARNNGVYVFANSNEYESSPGKPALLCQANYHKIGSLWVAKIDVQLIEEVVSIRTSKSLLVPTWENTVPGDRPVETVSFEQARDWLLEAVDEFCNAYRAMNPKTDP